MFVARAEMRHSRGKFILLTAAVALLVYLILVQQAISGALIGAFNGAIRNQTAPVLVYATDALRAPSGSVFPLEWEEEIATDASVATAARIGILSAPAHAIGGDPESTAAAAADAATTVTLWGAADPALGGPADPVAGRPISASGEAVGTAGDFELGQTVSLHGMADETADFQIVGLVADSQLAVQPTLYTSYADYEAAVTSLNPDARTVLPSLIAVEPAGPVADTVSALTEASADLDPLSREAAADLFPGVAPVRTSFLIILGLFGFVVPLVTGLFFLILTFQKTRSLTLLSAMGSRRAVLVRSLLFQVLAVLIGGLGVGVGLYALTTLFEVGSLTLVFSWPTVALWCAILLTLGVLSALVSVRRVLAIEPVEATKGGH